MNGTAANTPAILHKVGQLRLLALCFAKCIRLQRVIICEEVPPNEGGIENVLKLQLVMFKVLLTESRALLKNNYLKSSAREFLGDHASCATCSNNHEVDRRFVLKYRHGLRLTRACLLRRRSNQTVVCRSSDPRTRSPSSRTGCSCHRTRAWRETP